MEVSIIGGSIVFENKLNGSITLFCMFIYLFIAL